MWGSTPFMPKARVSLYQAPVVQETPFGTYLGIDPSDSTIHHGRGCQYEVRKCPMAGTIPLGLAGRTLGLVGAGKLGASTGKIAKAFNMKVIAWSPNLTPERAKAADVGYGGTRAELFKQSEVISIHMFLSDTTHHMITYEDFIMMKNGSLSRGWMFLTVNHCPSTILLVVSRGYTQPPRRIPRGL